MDFSLRELECFVAVAEELSFTRAAERLRLAQPPLSRHIKNLEEKVGVRLLERSRREVSMTSAGEAFLGEAREILLQVRRAGETARRAAEGEIETLEIGFVSAVLSPELVEVFSSFRRLHPSVKLNLHDRLPVEQMVALEAGDLDLGFVGVAPEKYSSKLMLTSWRKESLMVFLPLDHKFSRRRTVELKELEGEPFVMISSEAAPAYVSHLRRLCREAGFQPQVVQEARRAQAVAAMTVAGSGVAILPTSLNRITKNGIDLLNGGEESVITHVVAHGLNRSASVGEFLELLSES